MQASQTSFFKLATWQSATNAHTGSWEHDDHCYESHLPKEIYYHPPSVLIPEVMFSQHGLQLFEHLLPQNRLLCTYKWKRGRREVLTMAELSWTTCTYTKCTLINKCITIIKHTVLTHLLAHPTHTCTYPHPHLHLPPPTHPQKHNCMQMITHTHTSTHTLIYTHSHRTYAQPTRKTTARTCSHKGLPLPFWICLHPLWRWQQLWEQGEQGSHPALQ